MTIALAHDLETFDSANAVLDVNTSARTLKILFLLLGGQFCGSTSLKCAHKVHFAIKANISLDGRPRLFGGCQRGSGTR